MISSAVAPLRSLVLVSCLLATPLIVALIASCGASTETLAGGQTVDARTLVTEIAQDLVVVRDMGGADTPEDNLSLAQVTARLDYLDRVDQKLELLHTQFADSEILEQRSTRRIIERHRAQQVRLERLQSRLSAALTN